MAGFAFANPFSYATAKRLANPTTIAWLGSFLPALQDAKECGWVLFPFR
jgi:hypothetical protein